MKKTKNELSDTHTVLHILRAIVEEEDADKINIYENIMVRMCESILLFIASATNFVIRYFILQNALKISLYTSMVFLIPAIAFAAMTRVNPKSNIMTLIIFILAFIISIFVSIVHYDIIGPAIWTVAFIQILLVLTRTTKTVLYFIASVLIISGVYILYHSRYISLYHPGNLYYAVQIALFIIVFAISAVILQINAARYKNINKRYKELREKNKDITSLYEKISAFEEKNRYIAYHDILTGLPNSLFLGDKLDYVILSSNKTKKPFAVIFLDLDNFRMINESMGHAFGDQLLMKVSERLTKTMSEWDTVIRINGDEFAVLVEELEDINSVPKIANRIIHALSQRFTMNNQDFFITTSIGISIYPADGQNAEVLVENADIALYKAKANGGNQYAFCTQEMRNKGIENIKLSNSLYCALERNELELFYQPQVEIGSGKIVGMEALLRWNNPELGRVPPGIFIPIAEKTGLIIPIGSWVLHTACKQIKIWQDAGLPQIPVSVNLSVRQFQDYNIVDKVKEILIETGLDPHYLELEVTESIAMKEKGYMIETLNKFRNMGIAISVDDFGTEYSSMNYLKQLPVDKIKIAMPFIHGIGVNSKDEAISKAIIILAKSMGMRVVAEGVETESQLSFLAQRMCDDVQGYYYFKPMPADQVERLFSDNLVM